MKDSKQMVHLLNLASRQISKSFNERMAPSGLYAAQWTVIRYILKNGPSTQIAMSSYLGVEAPTMTRTINRLEKAGLIVRKEGKDRREKIINLTDLALSKIPNWEAEIDQFEAPLFESLTDSEVSIANKVLEKIVLSIKQQDKTGGNHIEERDPLD